MAITVLVVDDSAVVRQLITQILDSQPDINVVGTARDGRQAIELVEKLQPDVVTLDIEMPVMGGLEALAHIRKKRPATTVIMCSSLTERGAAITIDALGAGAADYVTKPSSTGSILQSAQRMEELLLPRVRALGARSAPARALRRASANPARPTPVEVVVIGISTGGPQALASVIPQIPVLGVPILIVQHMPKVFTRLLAERLDRSCDRNVREAQGGEFIEPDDIWIAPGGYHMRLERVGTRLQLERTSEPPENNCRPAVDVLFRSAAEACGAGVFGVVMTGMGRDGARGTEDIVKSGGAVIAQDEASSVVWGMPGAVAATGMASEILPLDEIPNAIHRRVASMRRTVRRPSTTPIS